MEFTLTDEQSILRDSLSAFLAETFTLDRRRALLANPEGDPGLWRAFADDLGLLGATFPEEWGGLGGGPIDTMVIMETLGAHLVLEPYVETVVLGGGVLRRSCSPLAGELIEQIIAGEARIAFAFAEPQARYNLRNIATTARRSGAGYLLNGHKALVVGAPQSDMLLVTARTGGERRDATGVSLFAVPTHVRGVERRDYRTIDGRLASEICLEGIEVGPEALLTGEGEALPLIEQVVDEAIAAICAEANGVLRRLLNDTVAYTRERRQFGAPLSSFQALQHRMVNMLIETEQAASMTWMATLNLAAPERERALAVSAAKVRVGEACRTVGQGAIQLHGGMGITDELAVGHFFKRATLIESQFGSSDHHLARYARLS